MTKLGRAIVKTGKYVLVALTQGRFDHLVDRPTSKFWRVVLELHLSPRYEGHLSPPDSKIGKINRKLALFPRLPREEWNQNREEWERYKNGETY